MRVLQFKTQQELDEWLNDNELFQCYDKDMNLLGEIIGTDADLLVSFRLAEINMTYRFCQITQELTDKQREELNKNRLVKAVVTNDLFMLSLEQRVVIKRLRKNFEDAKKVGLMMLTDDGYNRLSFINGNAFDGINSSENIEGDWKYDENDGVSKYVKASEEEKSQWVEVDEDLYCERIDGDKQIDFCNWSSSEPIHVHLKL